MPRPKPADEGEKLNPTVRRRAFAYAALAVVVLAMAAGIQVVASVVDLGWLTSPVVTSMLVGVLLVVAVQLPPLRDRRMLDLIAMLVPVVERYQQREQQRATNGRLNWSRMTKLQQVVAFNALAAIPRRRVVELGKDEERTHEIGDIIKVVAADVFATTVWTDPAPTAETQQQVLNFLYCDATRGVDGHPLTQRVEDHLVEPLVDVLMGTAHVQRTCALRTEVKAEVEGLQLDFNTAKLLDRLSLVPTDAVARMRRVFENYSLLELARVPTDSSGVPIWDWAAIERTVMDRGGDQVTCCAEVCADMLAGTDRPISTDVLSLLYAEHFNPSTEGTWKTHRGALVTQLAALLADADRVPDADLLPDFVSPGLKQADILRRLLVRSRYYRLPLLRGELVVLDGLRRMLEDYRRFLADQGFPFSPTTSTEEQLIDLLEHHVDGGLPLAEMGVERIARADSTIALLYAFGSDVTGRFHRDVERATYSTALGLSPLPPGSVVPEPVLEAISLVALHLYVFEEEVATAETKVALARLMRSHGPMPAALVLAARDAAVEDVPEGAAVALHDVVSRWASLLDAARSAGPDELDRRIDDARRRLVSLTRAPGPAARPPTSTMAPSEVARQFDSVRRSLDRLALDLRDHDLHGTRTATRLDDLEVELSALTAGMPHDEQDDEWIVHPYLITYDKDAGPLAELLDSLASPNAEQRTVLARLGVPLSVDDRSKYRFANFTRQARLGFLPRATTFDAFLADFEHDLRIVLEHRDEVLGYQIVPPRTTTTLTVGGRPPLTIASQPDHGSCVLHPRSGTIEYTPFPDDYRGSDELLVDDADHERRVVSIAVRPDLRRVEVTVSLLQLTQFAELVVDRHIPSPLGRQRSSVECAVDALAGRGQLDPTELAVIRRHLPEIIGT